MKITLEFDSKAEHDKYVHSFFGKRASDSEDKFVPVYEPIEDVTRRKHFSDAELEFVKENYPYKKTRWIAKQLRRKVNSVQALIVRMQKNGLPRKRARRNKPLIEIQEKIKQM